MSMEKHLSQSNKIRTMGERLAEVEKQMSETRVTLSTVTGVVDREVGGLVQQLNQYGEVINALTAIVGSESVQSYLNERATEAMNNDRLTVDNAVKSGALKVAEKISQTSVIVFEEKDKDGNVRHPGLFFKNVGTLNPQAVETLKDKPVGFVVGIGNGATMHVKEIYDPSTEAPAATIEEIPAPKGAPVVAPVTPTSEATN